MGLQASERGEELLQERKVGKASAVPPTPLLGPVLVPPALMALIFGHRGLVKVSQTIRGATVDDAGEIFSDLYRSAQCDIKKCDFDSLKLEQNP